MEHGKLTEISPFGTGLIEFRDGQSRRFSTIPCFSPLSLLSGGRFWNARQSSSK